MLELSDCDSSPSKRAYDQAGPHTEGTVLPLALQLAGNGVAEPSKSDEKLVENEDSDNPYHLGKDMFFPVPDCEVTSFQTSSPDAPRPLSSGVGHGRKVVVNGRELALFCHREKFYAVDERCPHLGGPLHLGDIEDIGQGLPPRIVCPWHKWCFDLDSGRQVRPHHQHKNIHSYPVRTKPSGQIVVGFHSFDATYFNTEDF